MQVVLINSFYNHNQCYKNIIIIYINSQLGQIWIFKSRDQSMNTKDRLFYKPEKYHKFAKNPNWGWDSYSLGGDKDPN